MGVMTKMRESTGVILWILVLSFGGLWVLQDSGAFENIGLRQRENIAEVDGEPISYREYTEALESELRAYQQRTGEAAPQAVRDQYADLIYERLIENKLRERAMDRLGIRVSDAEVRAMVLGDNPDPLLTQLFPDGQGGVDRARAVSLFEDPTTFQQAFGIGPVEFENYLRAKRRAEKLEALLGAAVRVTAAEVEAEYIRRNRSASAEYVALRYAGVPDSAVSVSDRDLRAYYDDHREDFKRERTVTAQYVSLSQQPSPEDSAAVLGDLQRLRTDFAQAEDDSAFVARQFSATPYSSEYVGAGNLEPEMASAVFETPQPGRVIGPLLVGNEARLIKITGVRPAESPSVRARHILIGQRGDSEAQRAEQLAEAQRIQQQIQSGAVTFEEAARQYSQDPGSASRGGDLGWFGEGRMVEPFEEAALGAPVGAVVGPVETEFGYHLIQVEARAEQEVQLAVDAHPVGTTSATLRALRDRIEDIQYYTEEGGDFAAEAQRQGLEVQEVTVQGEQQFIPGLGTNQTLRSFLERARRGDLSDVIDTGDAFVVLRVTDVQPEGYRPFDAVRAEIEPRVRLEKKKDVQVAKLREALQQAGGDLQVLSRAVGVPVNRAGNVTLHNPTVPGFGREPRFVGTVLGLEEGGLSGVVAGENAAFVVRTTQINEVDPASIAEQERQSLRQQLLNQKRQQLVQQWTQDLRDEADITDNRALFF